MILLSKRPGVGRFWVGAATRLQQMLLDAGATGLIKATKIAPGCAVVYHQWITVAGEQVDAVRLLAAREEQRAAEALPRVTVAAPADVPKVARDLALARGKVDRRARRRQAA